MKMTLKQIVWNQVFLKWINHKINSKQQSDGQHGTVFNVMNDGVAPPGFKS